MMQLTSTRYWIAPLMIVLLAFTSCKKDDDDDQPMPAAMAEFEVTIENVLPNTVFSASGQAPDGLLLPGDMSSFSFHAGPGDYLSFATMFVQSNDLFYAFDETGLPLYDANGDPMTGDVTAYVDLWDAGTEVNEEPGVGPNQAPRQSGPDTGMDEDGTVQRIADVNDGYDYPMDEDIIRLTLSHDGGTYFTMTIENVSGASSLPSPLSPGVFVVHSPAVQLFEVGEPASEGLEDIAEDGANQVLLDLASSLTGYSSPFSPGLWVVHEGEAKPIFAEGEPDYGEGLELLAEDGDPSLLANALGSKPEVLEYDIFNMPEGDAGPGPLLPGSAYSFTFTAEEGAYLNVATMLIKTNDLFYAFADKGLALFANGMPMEGDVTNYIELWDAGTEVNEYPGAGPNQPLRGGPDTGMDENGLVREVNDGFQYPDVGQSIRVTLSAEPL